jgi:hypothetical protein
LDTISAKLSPHFASTWGGEGQEETGKSSKTLPTLPWNLRLPLFAAGGQDRRNF